MDYRYPETYPIDACIPAVPARDDSMELAKAYIPYQQYVNSYPPMEALDRGTMFPELFSPYPAEPHRRK